MDRMIFIAMSGAKEAMSAQALNSNNLANAGTTGFRADFHTSLSQQVYGPGGQPDHGVQILHPGPPEGPVPGCVRLDQPDAEVPLHRAASFACSARMVFTR